MGESPMPLKPAASPSTGESPVPLNPTGWQPMPLEPNHAFRVECGLALRIFIFMRNIPCQVVIVVFLLLFVAGCAPQNPYESRIKAVTPEQLTSWLMFNTRDLKDDEITEMNMCIGEIKTHLRATRASSEAGIEERLCAELDGKPLKWVFTEGYRLRFESLKAERELHIADLKHKERLRTRPGDTASADYLEHQKDLRRAQIAEFTDKINKAEARYIELLKKFDTSGQDAK